MAWDKNESEIWFSDNRPVNYIQSGMVEIPSLGEWYIDDIGYVFRANETSGQFAKRNPGVKCRKLEPRKRVNHDCT